MAKITKYCKHPKYIIWVMAIVSVVALAGTIVYFAMGSWYRFYGILYIMISISQGLLVYDAYGLSVDEENRTIISKADKKHPIDIMKIDRIARHVSKKGKLRYITVHEAGVRYEDLGLGPDDDAAFFSQLKSIKPDIEIVEYEY